MGYRGPNREEWKQAPQHLRDWGGEVDAASLPTCSLRLPRPIVLIESPPDAAFETRGAHNKSTIHNAHDAVCEPANC